jgi:tetratricopeptide (TPR) repeat protein
MRVRPSAEESYRKGLAALEQGRRREALALFDAAIEIERRHGGKEPPPRYLSYFGLCLALELRRFGEAVRCCREAAEGEFFNPEIHLNLGRVFLAANRRREAIAALHQGLRWDKRHAAILRELRSLGRRRRPVLPFLDRRHPINVMLGRLTYAPQATPPRA